MITEYFLHQIKKKNMKKYIRKPDQFVRIEILERGNSCKNISVESNDVDSVMEWVKEMSVDFIKSAKICPLDKPKGIRVSVMLVCNKKRTDYRTKAFYNVEVEEFHEFLLSKLS
jgi:hypothetical protein